MKLAAKKADRLDAYFTLFEQQLAEHSLLEIREATNKYWVLGGQKFKDQIAKQSGRASSPKSRGGDRKSEGFKELENIL